MSAEATAVLVRAREMVDDGWVQGTGYIRDASGVIAKRCAGQAIQDAYGEVVGGAKFQGCMCGSCSQVGGEVFQEAMREFQRTIDYSNIPAWNDASIRTKKQVLAAFDTSIERMREREGAKVKIATVPEKIEATWKAVAVPDTEFKIVIPVLVDEPPKTGVFAKVRELVGV